MTPIERYAMKFVEESEGAFSAAQLAAAERELEEQKKEWELDRLRALREEEERRMRLADDDEKPLTFGREDAQNQVNSASNSKKLVNKKLPPNRRRNSRKNISKSAQESESETETTTESESESQEDVVEDSLDEESSHTESQSQGDEDEEEETNDQNDSGKGGYPKRKNRSNKSFSQNHFDLNSPRTRSRGNVKINLWTLDVSPILPGIKPKCRGRASNLRKQRELEMRMKAEENFVLPSSPVSSCKKLNNANVSNKFDEENIMNQKGITSDLKSTDSEQDTILPAEELSESIENCKVIANHCIVATSSPKSKYIKTITIEESNSIPLNSVEAETCSQSGNSSGTSEQCKNSEESIIDDKVCDEDVTDMSSSIYITQSMYKLTAQSSNSEGDASYNDDSENSNVDLISQSSNSCLSTIESNTIKRISDSKCLKNSITLEIDEEINISENSLIAPLKNKMITQDIDENTGEFTEKLNDSISKNEIISSNINEVDMQIKEELLTSNSIKLKTLEDKIVYKFQDTNVSDDECGSKNDARTQTPTEKENVNIEETFKNKEQFDESTSNSNMTHNDTESISVIESRSSQEFSSIKQESFTKLDECMYDENDSKIQLTSSIQSSDNTFSFDILNSNESCGSESNLENKVKFRKPDISYGVITRSAKININVDNSENKNLETHTSLILSDESCESKQNQGNENSNSISNTHRKEVSKMTQIRRPDTPRPIIEQVRITRSSVVRSLTPPPSSNPMKSVHKKRPDTPLSECFKSSPRPATRSTSNINSPLRNEEQNTTSYERPMTRSSKSLDNGFLNPPPFRRSSSIPPMKPISEKLNEMKDCSSVSTRSKKNNEFNNINISTRRRPDTPVPTSEQTSRVTRSGLNFMLNLGKSSPNHMSNKGNKHIRKTDLSSDSKAQEEESSISSKTETLNTDSNGNAVVSETFTKHDDPLSTFNDINEKPQRTAKVVAILTLDTRSNYSNKASSSVHTKTSNCNSTDTKNNKKNVDSNSNSGPDSSEKNCVLRISDVTSNCKLDGWCSSGLDNRDRDRVSSNVYSNVASTYTNSSKSGKTSTMNKNTSLNSKLKTDKVSLPVQSTVIALVDLDNDPNYDSSDSSKRLRRKIKRTRLSSFAKPLIRGKTNESQIIDTVGDEEQIPPFKKAIRSQLPTPPPPSQTTQLEKLSSGTIS